MAADSQVKISITVDAKDADKAIKGLQKNLNTGMKGIVNDSKNASIGLKATSKEVVGLGKTAEVASVGIVKTAEANKKLGTEMSRTAKLGKVQGDALSKSFDNIGVSSENMGRTLSRNSKLGIVQGNALAKSFQGLGEQVQKPIDIKPIVYPPIDFKQTFKGVENVGNTLTKTVSLPLLAIGAGAITAAIQFEDAFAGVRKTVDASEPELQKLSSSFRQLSKDIPVSAVELSGIGEAAGQLGIKTENILGFTRVMADLGVATNMSSEQAATSLARLANITGMPQTAFDRLGSTIVALGNNMATTESEITEMGLRLAGAGKQVGLSEHQILGFAAALSSVGIEAEAGGSAFSKVMVNMKLAAIRGGEDLQNFAKVAGVSAEEFKTAYEQDAAGALVSFISGLKRVNEEGGSAIEVLDGMEITEVRMRDALLRASGASDVFTKSLSIGSKAWEENNALTTEAEQKYKTTASKLKIFQNRITDVGITFGDKMIPAFTRSLDSIEKVVTAFGNLDDKTQDVIIKGAMLAFGLGPVVSTLGKVGGAAATGIGALTKMSGAMKAVQSGTETALPAIGSFGKLLGLLNPATVGAVLGIGAVALVAYGVVKAFQDSQTTVKTWGGEVPKAVAGTVDAIGTNMQKAKGHLSLLQDGTALSTGEMVKSFEAVGQTIENDLSNKVEAFKKQIETLPEALKNAGLGELFSSEAKKLEEANNIVKENNAKMAAIKQNAIDNGREMTATEGAMISKIMQDNAAKYLEITIDNKEERAKIMESMTGDVASASKEQATEWLQNLGKQNQTTAMTYDNMKKEQEKFLTSMGKTPDSDLWKETMAILEQSHGDATKSMDSQINELIKKYPELANEIFLSNGQMIDSTTEYADGMKSKNKEILKAIQEQMDATGKMSKEGAKNLDLLTLSTEGLGKEWDDLIFDPKTGEVKDNFPEVIKGMADTEEGWDKLKLMSKEANLTSNAKQLLAEVALQNGKWDLLTWEEKQALVTSTSTQTVLKALEDNGIWALMTFEQKQAILTSNTPEQITRAALDIGMWDSLAPTVKELNATNYSLVESIATSEGLLNMYNGLTPEQKTLVIDGAQTENVDVAYQSITAYQGLPDPIKTLITENADAMTKLTDANNKLHEWNNQETQSKEVKVTADTSGATQAQEAINSVTGKSVTVSVNYQKNGSADIPEHAVGTSNFSGGLTYINERGPEIANLPNGTQIIPHALSKVAMRQYGREMASSGSSGSSDNVSMQSTPVYVGAEKIADIVYQPIKKKLLNDKKVGG